MKRFFLINIIISVIFISVVVSCGNGGSSSAEDNDAVINNGVEVIYFHGKQRCVTCNAIERLTKEVVESDFSKDIEDGRLVFKVVDISKVENNAIADRYEVSWSSLFINSWIDGNETRTNMTNFGFSYAKNSPEVFKDSIRTKLSELLRR